MSNDNYFKVAWCPICEQGWVEIVKDIDTNKLYVLCDECENEWETPMDINKTNAQTEIVNNRVTSPSLEEIKKINWEKYILTE